MNVAGIFLFDLVWAADVEILSRNINTVNLQKKKKKTAGVIRTGVYKFTKILCPTTESWTDLHA